MLDEKVSLGKCPKCGHGKIQSETCIRCGLIFNKYDEVQARKRMMAHEQKISDQPVVQRKKQVGMVGLLSIISGIVSILIVGLGLGANNMAVEKKKALEIAFEEKQYLKAEPYEEAEKELNTKPNFRGNQRPIHQIHIPKAIENLMFHIYSGKKSFEEGVTLGRLGDLKGAAEKFEEALRNLEESNHMKSIALTNLNLAICYQALHKKKDSLACFEKALEISRENGFEKYEAKALQGSGLIYSHLGQYEKALSNLDRALAIHADISDMRGEAMDWLIMGIIEYNNPAAGAGNCFQQALALSKENGDPFIELKARRLLHRWLRGVSASSASDSESLQPETS